MRVIIITHPSDGMMLGQLNVHFYDRGFPHWRGILDPHVWEEKSRGANPQLVVALLKRIFPEVNRVYLERGAGIDLKPGRYPGAVLVRSLGVMKVEQHEFERFAIETEISP